MAEYLHQDPGTEIRFIAGHYTIIEEQRIAHCGRELLCVVGVAAVESTCCGTQGCRFINIPGYVADWKGRLSADGVPVSIVEPVASESDRAEIREVLERRFPYSQILFPA
jgi:hypothetical protein